MQSNLIGINLKFVMTVSLILLSSVILTQSNASAQNSKRRIYAAVLSNVSYTVGAKNSGVGLYLGDDGGAEWENIAFKNMRTFAIEIFPEHGDGLFYTANGNGVIVSRDGGKSWRVTTGWEITEVLEAAAVPDHPEIIYIGTAYGVWKSTEYGENWQKLTKRFVNSLHIDVKDASRIYVGEEDGLVISQNAGKSFKRVKNFPHAVNSIAQDSANPNRLYLGTEDNGLFLSDNRGKSCQQITAAKTATIYSVTVDPKNSNIVFASTFADGILRSVDQGKTWQTITRGVAAVPVDTVAFDPDDSATTDKIFSGEFGEGTMQTTTSLDDIPVYTIVFHPDDSTIIYAGTVNRGILRSTDGGDSWAPFALDGTHIWDLEIK